MEFILGMMLNVKLFRMQQVVDLKNYLNSKRFFSNALQKIEHISVREDSLASLLQPLIDKEIKIVIDPTLLAGRRIFDKIANTI